MCVRGEDLNTKFIYDGKSERYGKSKFYRLFGRKRVAENTGTIRNTGRDLFTFGTFYCGEPY